MTKEEAFDVLRNTALLGTDEQRNRVEQAIEVVQFECDIAYTKGITQGYKECTEKLRAIRERRHDG